VVPHYFLRTAVVNDDLGETYNMLALAGAINRDWQKIKFGTPGLLQLIMEMFQESTL
jgi:hypothetical protein